MHCSRIIIIITITTIIVNSSIIPRTRAHPNRVVATFESSDDNPLSVTFRYDATRPDCGPKIKSSIISYVNCIVLYDNHMSNVMYKIIKHKVVILFLF